MSDWKEDVAKELMDNACSRLNGASILSMTPEPFVAIIARHAAPLEEELLRSKKSAEINLRLITCLAGRLDGLDEVLAETKQALKDAEDYHVALAEQVTASVNAEFELKAELAAARAEIFDLTNKAIEAFAFTMRLTDLIAKYYRLDVPGIMKGDADETR